MIYERSLLKSVEFPHRYFIQSLGVEQANRINGEVSEDLPKIEIGLISILTKRGILTRRRDLKPEQEYFVIKQSQHIRLPDSQLPSREVVFINRLTAKLYAQLLNSGQDKKTFIAKREVSD